MRGETVSDRCKEKRVNAVCRVFAHQPPETYEGRTRSIRIGGHCTSIRLEAAFWAILEKIAVEEGVSLGRFLTTLHDEVIEHRGEVGNFASLLRCACLVHLSGRDASPSRLSGAILQAAE